MIDTNDLSSSKQISVFIGVIAAGVLTALAFALFLLFFFNPSGSYKLENVLPSPENLQQLQYEDFNPQTGHRSTFVFDSMEFSFYDAREKRWIKQAVDIGQYGKFYALVLNNKNILEPTEELKRSFDVPFPATLEFLVHDERAAVRMAKVFMKIHFSSEGDDYRVELRQKALGEPSWAYFHHPHIYEIVKKKL